jgi:pyridoxine 4-dehydrogenase
VARIGLGTNRLTKTAAHVVFVRGGRCGSERHRHCPHLAGGGSEETIGAALSPIPEDCIVATKGGWNGARPETLRAEAEESLRRLRTDSIALYYLHRVDPQTPLEESLGAIKEYRDSGKIRQVGVSNVGIEQIERARQVVPISAVQNRFNLSERTHDDVVDYCAREGLVFLPYFPLHGDGRPALAEIADRHGATPAQIALA